MKNLHTTRRQAQATFTSSIPKSGSCVKSATVDRQQTPRYKTNSHIHDVPMAVSRSPADDGIHLLADALLTHAEEILVRRVNKGVTLPSIAHAVPARRKTPAHRLSQRQAQILDVLPNDGVVHVAALHRALEHRVPLDTIKRSLATLVALGLVERAGSGRSAAYRRISPSV